MSREQTAELRDRLAALKYRNWSGPGDAYPSGGYLLSGGMLADLIAALAPTVSGGEGWEELERLARAATPGPWLTRTLENFGWNVVHYRNGDKFDIERVAKSGEGANAEFIAAADPQTVLALIAVARGGGKEAEAETFPRCLVVKPERVEVFGALAQGALVPTVQAETAVVGALRRARSFIDSCVEIGEFTPEGAENPCEIVEAIDAVLATVSTGEQPGMSEGGRE